MFIKSVCDKEDRQSTKLSFTQSNFLIPETMELRDTKEITKQANRIILIQMIVVQARLKN